MSMMFSRNFPSPTTTSIHSALMPGLRTCRSCPPFEGSAAAHSSALFVRSAITECIKCRGLAPVKAWFQRAILEGREHPKQQPHKFQLRDVAVQLLVLWHELPVVLEQLMQAGPPWLFRQDRVTHDDTSEAGVRRTDHHGQVYWNVHMLATLGVRKV